ncbi:MAG: amino acid ABC transporter permease [Alphaproteobacteria bacterium]|nr:amino acid ABC transporter permease [Alphaproteobacteria bacterium]
MSYQWHFGVIGDYWFVFLRGGLATIWITLGSAALALVLGLPLGLLRGSQRRLLRLPATAYIEFVRGTPALVQIVWIYYCLPLLTGLRLDPVTTIVLAIGLHAAAFVAEIFRAGVNAVDRGQLMAAYSIGMGHLQALRRIILPQAVRKMIPPFINEFASLIKLTTLGSVIAVYELLHAANGLIATVYRPLEIYTFLALAFFVVIYPIICLSQWAERYFARRI